MGGLFWRNAVASGCSVAITDLILSVFGLLPLNGSPTKALAGLASAILKRLNYDQQYRHD